MCAKKGEWYRVGTSFTNKPYFCKASFSNSNVGLKSASFSTLCHAKSSVAAANDSVTSYPLLKVSQNILSVGCLRISAILGVPQYTLHRVSQNILYTECTRISFTQGVPENIFFRVSHNICSAFFRASYCIFWQGFPEYPVITNLILFSSQTY